MDSAVIEARRLAKTYGAVVALHPLDLAVPAGEIVCLLGANGAGKTTAMNLFLGFAEASGGEARVMGQLVSDDPAAARKALGYVAEQAALYPLLTGHENRAFFAGLAGRTLPADAGAVLDALRLAPEAMVRPVGEWSKGMRQKLALAIALDKGAKAILLDEPLSGLDPVAANELVALLKQTAAAGVAMLVATHDIFRAREMADRIAILKAGRLVAWVDPRAVTGGELEALYVQHMAEQRAA
jgi:ABC-2 type transport system ATP-binding protein